MQTNLDRAVAHICSWIRISALVVDSAGLRLATRAFLAKNHSALVSERALRVPGYIRVMLWRDSLQLTKSRH